MLLPRVDSILTHVQSSNFSLPESRSHSGTDDATKHIFWRRAGVDGGDGRWLYLYRRRRRRRRGERAASNHDFAFPRCNTLASLSLSLETNRSTFISPPALSPPLSPSFILPPFSSFDPENKSPVMSNEAAKNAIILSPSMQMSDSFDRHAR